MAEKYKKQALLIGCVGKPNAGKSSFLNATTDAKAKVGNYPFTTIDPNQGIAHYTVRTPITIVMHLILSRWNVHVQNTIFKRNVDLVMENVLTALAIFLLKFWMLQV